jgi:cyclopropane fatty-acyl-phospholipid synthase-like methyltransferase
MHQYDVIADFYDLWARGDPACLPSENFYRRLCLSTPGTLVEIGVGTGRIALTLASNGRSVVGIDSSEQMLTVCRQKADQLGVSGSIVLIRMDARNLGLRNIDLIILPFRTIGHFTTPEARRQLFSEVHAALSLGGLFVFDHYILDRAWAQAHHCIPRLMHHSRSSTGGGVLIWDTYRYHFTEEHMDCLITLERTDTDGVVVTRRHIAFPFALVAQQEIAQLAAATGFKVDAVHGSFDEDMLTADSTDQVWTLRKT